MLLTGGQVLKMFIALGSSVIIARMLGPSGLGTLATVAAVIGVLYTFCDFGLSNAAVKFISMNYSDSKQQAEQTTQTFTALKSLFSVGMVFVTVAAAPVLCTRFLNRPELAPLLILAALGLITTSFNGTVSAVLQALKKFKSLVRLQIIMPVMSLIAVAGLAVAHSLTVKTVILVGIFVPAIVFLFGLLEVKKTKIKLFPKAVFKKKALLSPETKALLKFAKWMWVVMILSSLVAQLDLLFLNRMTDRISVGVYALALNIAFRFDVLNQSFLTVLLPEASVLSSKKDYWHFIKNASTKTIPIAGLIFVALLFMKPAVLLFYGTQYAAAVHILYILLPAVCFDLIASPVFLLAYPLNKPTILATLDLIRVVILAFGCILFIPQIGVEAAAWSKLAAKVLAGLWGVMVIFRSVKRHSIENLQSGHTDVTDKIDSH